MYYSYVEIEYVAMSFSPARTDLAVKLLMPNVLKEGVGGEYGVLEAMETKVGCNCFGQNCFGNEYGIGCWKCVELAIKNGDILANAVVASGVSCFDCDVCWCICHATFKESKCNQIAKSLKKN